MEETSYSRDFFDEEELMTPKQELPRHISQEGYQNDEFEDYDQEWQRSSSVMKSHHDDDNDWYLGMFHLNYEAELKQEDEQQLVSIETPLYHE